MGIRHRIIEVSRLVVFRHEGVVSDEELRATYISLFSDDAFPHHYDKIVDLRLADSSVRSVEALREIGTVMRGRVTSEGLAPRQAIIAPEDVSFGLGRVFSAWTSDMPGTTRVFRSADEAFEWLGVDEAVVVSW